MTILQDKNCYRISCRYIPRLIEEIKYLRGRRYDPAKKTWMVPLSEKASVEAFAKRWGFRFMSSDVQRDEFVGERPPMPELTVDIPLGIELFDYQKRGVAYNLIHKKTIVGDKPGLGKTAQAIATVIGAEHIAKTVEERAFPCLIICPSSLKINWQREVDKFSGGKCLAIILSDKNKRTYLQYWEYGLAQFFIVNYENLKKFFVTGFTNREHQRIMLKHIQFNDNIKAFRSIIIDESHRCKNGSTQQSKFCMGIAKGKNYVLELTGTPLINRPEDLIPQLHIMGLLPTFGGYKHFVERYCAGENRASNLKELNYLLNLHCFYQREKKDVLKDLPAKMRRTVICEISNRKEYDDAFTNLQKYLRDYRQATDKQIRKAMKGEIIVRMTVLRQIAARGKVKDVCEFIDDLLESGEKLVLFMNLIELGNAFKERYPDAVLLRGGMSDSEKQKAVDRFQEDPTCQLAICNIKAAGVGLTLTAASNVAFVESPWTYADCEQCEDRAHRIGQTDSVTCYYFLGHDTIDEHMYEIIQQKKSIAAAVTGSEDHVEESVIDSYINLFNQN